MSVINHRTDLHVLMLHNLDQRWEPLIIDEALREVAELESILREVGHPVENVPVYDANLHARLYDYDPENYIVLLKIYAKREIHGREAGVKTYLLISLGSSLIMVISEHFFFKFQI